VVGRKRLTTSSATFMCVGVLPMNGRGDATLTPDSLHQRCRRHQAWIRFPST
jgi:hypothetical protein